MSYDIAILPGDGIGPEVVAECVRVLERVVELSGGEVDLELETFDVGAGTWQRTGEAISDETYAACEKSDAILLGAVGLPDARHPDGREAGPDAQFRLRFGLDLFAGIRPIRLYPGAPTPLRDTEARIDYVIVRENTEGLYAGRPGGSRVDGEVVADTGIVTRTGTTRIAQRAFELAERRAGAPADGVSRVTCVDKANVLASYAFFREVVTDVSAAYADIELETAYVDAAALHLVQRPSHFDVIVAENMFGDILSDLGAATIGGLGLAPSGDVGEWNGLFQASHGSAPGHRRDGLGESAGDDPVRVADARVAGSPRRRRCDRARGRLDRGSGGDLHRGRLGADARPRRLGRDDGGRGRGTHGARRRRRRGVTDDDVRALIDDPARRAEVSVVELAEALLARLETRADLHATITLTPELALAQARAADVARARGRALPLDGMPLVIKDNVGIAGVPTTVGSRLFADRVASSDAEVTTRIRAAGGVILGTANLHELAFGATSANETFGAVVNPAAPDRIPGGSSGGSGAAVAADLCIAAIGTDTGGSVRLPASLCGVSGLRPTFGAVSTHGVQPVSVSLDTVGPLARSVTDVRELLASIAGFDSRDPASCERVLDLTVNDSVEGLRVGVVESLVERSDPDIAAAVRAVAAVLSESGAHLSPIEIDGWRAGGRRLRVADQGRGARRLPRGRDGDPRAVRGGHEAEVGARRRRRRRRASRPAPRAVALCRDGRARALRRRPAAAPDDPGRRASGGRSGHGRHDRGRRPVHAPAELRPPARPVDPVRRDLDRCAGRSAARGCAVA